MKIRCSPSEIHLQLELVFQLLQAVADVLFDVGGVAEGEDDRVPYPPRRLDRDGLPEDVPDRNQLVLLDLDVLYDEEERKARKPQQERGKENQLQPREEEEAGVTQHQRQQRARQVAEDRPEAGEKVVGRYVFRPAFRGSDLKQVVEHDEVEAGENDAVVYLDYQDVPHVRDEHPAERNEASEEAGYDEDFPIAEPVVELSPVLLRRCPRERADYDGYCEPFVTHAHVLEHVDRVERSGDVDGEIHEGHVRSEYDEFPVYPHRIVPALRVE